MKYSSDLPTKASAPTLMAESEEELKSLLMKVKNEREVAQLSPTLCDPMDCSPPGSSVHGVFQARALAWGAIAFSDLTAVGKLKSGWESVAWKPLSHEGTLIPPGPYQLVHHLPLGAWLFSISFMTSGDT